MGSYLFLQALTVVFLLSISTTLFNKKVLGFPAAIGVPIVSALFVFILQWAASLFNGSDIISINIEKIEATVRSFQFYDFLINGVICFILMASALKFKVSDLKRYWKPIGILASLALVICAVLFAGLLFGYQWLIGHKVDILVLLLLGAALGATDPIGIKGVLSSVRAPHHLMVKLEGESLFNDAMCIAVFMTILNIIKGDHVTPQYILSHLFLEIFIAIVIGVVTGHIALWVLKQRHEMESLIMTTAVLASGAYLIALYAHASAPIACVIAGLVVGNKWQEVLKEKEINEVNHFWHTMEGIINAFLFTLIGLELFIIDLSKELVFGGIIAFIILHISRFAANFLAFMFFPSVSKKSYNGSLTILSWGGVRGGLSLALILAVSNMSVLSDYSDVLIGYTFICVLLSGLVCGLGLPQVMNAFYYNPDEPKTGFSGWYQKICHKMNVRGVQYIIDEDDQGNEVISIYDPSALINKKNSGGEIRADKTVQEVEKEVKRLEHPDNF
ncbi:sodium:proton antiporter [Acinetobacter qingfengensis]|uniref:Sodium:proton antiporter n=1 Tax=Acinetobacter qingfengensis TaxID=1262585 RepID=A0A1E7REM3_9GAMM|nr:cation:proton antiporter [Acinetobacter qingfengensis]KAA8734759.1 sodium:proton antiporter [Acinetobacter qingfengensis]OEY97677.1 sodium:proton antiporter [Acinetobacter qingfengensis]